jgi:hypothetical protein
VAAVLSLLVPARASSEPAVSIDPVIRGTLGTNGWYVSNVTVNWTFNPPPDQSSGCDAVTLRTDGATTLHCSAWWGQIHIDYPLTISIDKTAPVAHGVPSRVPDANGWYNKPVTISFSATDSTSGVASCPSTVYSGPDNAAAAVSGTCTDKAGNVGSAVFSFLYDATRPTLGKVTLAHGNRRIKLQWTASSDTQLMEVARSPGVHGAKATTIYRGAGKAYLDKHLRVGARYRYTVTGFDPASNAASRTLATTATGPLVSPLPGARVTSPLRLAWTPVKGARYYNVQLFHGGKIFSAWPRRPQLRLPRSWNYAGGHYRLKRGRYVWYVWPGFGLLAQANYGRLLGSSSFVVSG